MSNIPKLTRIIEDLGKSLPEEGTSAVEQLVRICGVTEDEAIAWLLILEREIAQRTLSDLLSGEPTVSPISVAFGMALQMGYEIGTGAVKP